MSILSYFKPAENDSLYGEALHSAGPVTGTQVYVARELNGLIEEENKYGIPTAREWAKKQFKEYEFKRETVRDCQNRYRDMYIEEDAPYSRQDENDGEATLADWRRIGRPSMLSDESR